MDRREPGVGTGKVWIEFQSLLQKPYRLLIVFGGLTVEEVAEVLNVSKRTVESDWTMVRAWLRRELTEEPAT